MDRAFIAATTFRPDFLGVRINNMFLKNHSITNRFVYQNTEYWYCGWGYFKYINII